MSRIRPPRPRDAGDVRQGVDPPAGGSDDGGNGLFGGDVAGHGNQVQPGVLGDEVMQAFLADVGGDDAPAFAGDPQGGGLADAGGRTGDDDCLAMERREGLGPVKYRTQSLAVPRNIVRQRLYLSESRLSRQSLGPFLLMLGYCPVVAFTAE
ncbi:hypothetical protein SAMN04487916_12014 [Arthrobacter sp. ov407]|nr:hypothetical protein SAMN04487916_12014 [Arthrobacter sp. ov407]